MEYEPIISKLINKPKKLNFVVRKKKGEPEIFDIPNNEFSNEIYKYYLEARNLEPFGDYKTPYWSIIEILEPTFTRNRYVSEKQYHRFFSKETEYLYKKYMPINIYNELVFNNIRYSQVYYKYLDKSPKKILFLSNNYYQEDIEEFYFFREKNSIYSLKDKVDYAVIEDFLLDVNRKRDYQYLSEIEKKYSNFRLFKYEKNICNSPELDNLENDYNVIFLSPEIYYWPLKKFNTYTTSQFLFNCLVVSFDKLSRGGTLFFPIRDINNQIILDIIGIIAYYFKDVELFKGIFQDTNMYHKVLIAKNFKGVSKTDYQNLVKVSKEWDSIQGDCFTKTTKFSKENYYVKSILNYKGNLTEIQYFEAKEDEKKIDFFIKIINTYYELRNGGEGKLKELIDKKIYQSINILKFLGIFKKINNKKLEKEITKQEIELEYVTNMFKFNKGTKNLKQEIKTHTPNFTLDNLENITNRLKITKRTLDNISDSQFEDISKKLKKFITLRHTLETKYTFTKTSQGFIKMFEILKIFNLLDIEGKTHKTFHLCEAPGQFIMATNHYLKTETNNETFDWTAQSLIGNKALKDNYNLMKKYPTHWDFGPDKNGDITSLKNIKYYGQKKEMDLITFDCGFDFGDKTIQTYQDNFTAKLNYCQVLILLQSLKKGGSFVVKVFLPQTVPYIISINYILYCCFKELYLYKPFVNPVASEIYIIGRNFKGVEEKLINQLIDATTKLKEEDVLLNIPLDFLEEYERGIQKFVEANIENITNILYLSKNKKLLSDKTELARIRNKNTYNWIDYFDIKKIRKSELL